MTIGAAELYYDPWNVDLNADPYPMFKRFRDESPLYHNVVHDFYAVSRFEDVNRMLVDNQSFSSARGAVLEIIKSGMEIPPGMLIFEDPPAARPSPQSALPSVYASQGQRAGAESSRVYAEVS